MTTMSMRLRTDPQINENLYWLNYTEYLDEANASSFIILIELQPTNPNRSLFYDNRWQHHHSVSQHYWSKTVSKETEID